LSAAQSATAQPRVPNTSRPTAAGVRPKQPITYGNDRDFIVVSHMPTPRPGMGLHIFPIHRGMSRAFRQIAARHRIEKTPGWNRGWKGFKRGAYTFVRRINKI